MWIIFDLDDTLIDTSGSITPFVLKRVLQSMEKEGFKPADPKNIYSKLLEMNRESLDTQSGLLAFFEKYEVGEECAQVALKELSSSELSQPAAPLPQANRVLKTLSKDHSLVLVTRGEREFQLKKMASARIDQNFFTKCFFCPGESKKKYYQNFAIQDKIKREEVCVCGDRILLDLTPAKELGYHTVQIKWGRGRGNTGLKKDVDYTISCLGELPAIIQKITSRH